MQVEIGWTSLKEHDLMSLKTVALATVQHRAVRLAQEILQVIDGEILRRISHTHGEVPVESGIMRINCSSWSGTELADALVAASIRTYMCSRETYQCAMFWDCLFHQLTGEAAARLRTQ